ncbi:hypothetical protein P7K49_039826, partial [Saguinus oedipus]
GGGAGSPPVYTGSRWRWGRVPSCLHWAPGACTHLFAHVQLVPELQVVQALVRPGLFPAHQTLRLVTGHGDIAGWIEAFCNE